jgi:hypothetical protein
LSKKLEDAARSELTKMKLEAETKLKEEVKEKPTETIDTMSKEVTQEEIENLVWEKL